MLPKQRPLRLKASRLRRPPPKRRNHRPDVAEPAADVADPAAEASESAPEPEATAVVAEETVFKYQPGDIVPGTITAVGANGIEADLGDGALAVIPRAEIDGDDPAVGAQIEGAVIRHQGRHRPLRDLAEARRSGPCVDPHRRGVRVGRSAHRTG